MPEKSFDPLRDLPILEARANHFVQVLNAGTVSTNNYLRRLHNFALDMDWLPWPVLPKRHWPAVRYKVKRAITRAEHDLILSRETSTELQAFLWCCWHLGGSQTDVANLKAEDVDWENQVVRSFWGWFRRGPARSAPSRDAVSDAREDGRETPG